jgi:hypothetical protein
MNKNFELLSADVLSVPSNENVSIAVESSNPVGYAIENPVSAGLTFAAAMLASLAISKLISRPLK